MLNVIVVCVGMLSADLLSVGMRNVIMLSVVGPVQQIFS
jgi:hypothetical protein